MAEHQKPWELYNLAEDRSELHDLASRHPKTVEEMSSLWQKHADRIGVVEWASLQQSRRKPGPNYRRK